MPTKQTNKATSEVPQYLIEEASVAAAQEGTPGRAPDVHHDLSTERQNFAVAMGFASFGELLRASENVQSNDGENWYLTPLQDETWGAWNDVHLLFDRHYAGRDEALASIPHEAEVSGSAMLG